MQIHKLSLTGPGTCRPSTTSPAVNCQNCEHLFSQFLLTLE